MKTTSRLSFRQSGLIALLLAWLIHPVAARASIATVNLTTTIPEDNGLTTFSSVLEAVSVTFPSTRLGLTVELVEAPAHAFGGTFQLFASNSSTATAGQWVYRPDANYNECAGPEFFRFRVRSAQGEVSGISTMTIRVVSVNDRPIAREQGRNGDLSTRYNESRQILLFGEDADNTDGCPSNDQTLTFTIINAPDHGTLTGTGASRTYVPDGTFAGEDYFTYRVSDGIDRSSALVFIQVIPGLRVNDFTNEEGRTIPIGINLFPRYPEECCSGGKTVTVEWSTTDFTASGGIFPGIVTVDDYLSAGSIPLFPVTFQPGEGVKLGYVSTLEDDCQEINERFLVRLRNPTNAFIFDDTAVLTITNDDTTCRDLFGNLLNSCLCNGTFLGEVKASPGSVAVTAGEAFPYAITWTVPDPHNWRSLSTMNIRIGDDAGSVLDVVWEETANTFTLLHPANGRPGPGVTPGENRRFETPDVALDMGQANVAGSGPTGPEVTLNLALAFKPRAAGRTFTVEVSATDDSGAGQDFKPVGTITVVDPGHAGPMASGAPREEISVVDVAPSLAARAHPNPAHRGATSILYSVPADLNGSMVEVSVFDIAGRQIRTLTSEPTSAGEHTVDWDLKDARGRSVSNGIFFYRVTAGDEQVTGKLMVKHP